MTFSDYISGLQVADGVYGEGRHLPARQDGDGRHLPARQDGDGRHLPARQEAALPATPAHRAHHRADVRDTC